MKQQVIGTLILLAATALLAGPACAGDKAGIGWQETIAVKSGKAKTLAELAKCTTPVLVSNATRNSMTNPKSRSIHAPSTELEGRRRP